MRIGINTFALSAARGMAGSGRYILELSRALAHHPGGHEIILLANDDNWELLPEAGCTRIRCEGFTTVRPLRILWEQTALPALARRLKLDVLHSPVFIAPMWLPCASVVSILDMTWFLTPEHHTRAKGAYFRSMIPVSASRAAHIIAISEATKQDVVSLLDVAGEKVTVTHLGVDLERFTPGRAGPAAHLAARYGIKTPYVLYVGKLEPRKSLPTLIRAFDRIAGDFPAHQLVLAGNPGWDYAEVEATLHDIGCRERVRFTGFVEEADLPALYAAADLFVYPSLYEGFGFPVLEAMACGTPVITSNLSSLPEVAGDAALLVDPHDMNALANAMQQVLDRSWTCKSRCAPAG